MQMPGAFCQGIRDRTLARADFDNEIIFGRVDRADNGFDHTRVREKVLAESLSCPVPRHRRCASSAASSTAASRLPGSALPVPAMSKAVP